MDTKDSPASHFGNYVAIGTLEPEIEINSIDLLNSVYPDAVLNNPKETAAHILEPAGMGKKMHKKLKHRAACKAHHIDAILSLLWNCTVQQMLASGSTDRTVKPWDLLWDMKEGALHSFGKLHKDKVQAVQWNPTEPAMLLSGSYDHMVQVFDSRFMCIFVPVSPWWGYGFCWGLRCATCTRTLALPQLLPMRVSLPVTISSLPAKLTCNSPYTKIVTSR